MLDARRAVEKQYATPEHLNRRISIHEKYSVNRQGFGPWIFSHYEFCPGQRILELGCGTGEMWRGQADRLPAGCALLLTDFSGGMVAAARQTLGERANIAYQQMDIQAIPAADGAFDRVIANMMLYHVPDLEQALAEVKRVLKQDGVFYCATYGENGIGAFFSRTLADFGLDDRTNRRFTLQNGADTLKRFFGSVERLDYPDALAVTQIDDLVDYLYSLTGMASLDPAQRPAIREALAARMEQGVLTVPKEYGLFICRP